MTFELVPPGTDVLLVPFEVGVTESLVCIFNNPAGPPTESCRPPLLGESHLLELLEDAALSTEPRTPRTSIREEKVNRLMKREPVRHCCRKRSGPQPDPRHLCQTPGSQSEH